MRPASLNAAILEYTHVVAVITWESNAIVREYNNVSVSPHCSIIVTNFVLEWTCLTIIGTVSSGVSKGAVHAQVPPSLWPWHYVMIKPMPRKLAVRHLKSQWIQASSKISGIWLACSSHHLALDKLALLCECEKFTLDVNARLERMARDWNQSRHQHQMRMAEILENQDDDY